MVTAVPWRRLRQKALQLSMFQQLSLSSTRVRGAKCAVSMFVVKQPRRSAERRGRSFADHLGLMSDGANGRTAVQGVVQLLYITKASVQ